MPPRDDDELHIAETHSAAFAPDDFFAAHVQANRPLILRGAAAAWRATEWAADSLAASFGEEIVTVAPLCASGPHRHLDKWLEPAEAWAHDEPEPAICDARQLLVVSGMRVKMRLRKFARLLREDSKVEAGFYADGAGNLEHSFPFLRGDFAPPPFAAGLELKRADLWIGSKSISRMHYDNLDNVFAQVHVHVHVHVHSYTISRVHYGNLDNVFARVSHMHMAYAHAVCTWRMHMA